MTYSKINDKDERLLESKIVIVKTPEQYNRAFYIEFECSLLVSTYSIDMYSIVFPVNSE